MSGSKLALCPFEAFASVIRRAAIRPPGTGRPKGEGGTRNPYPDQDRRGVHEAQCRGGRAFIARSPRVHAGVIPPS
jgi:hypothetical protein